MLPAVLLEDFTAEQAAAFGVGLKTLARLRKSGLAVKAGDRFQLRTPVDPVGLALAALGPPAALCGASAAAFYDWPMLSEPEQVHVVVPTWRRPVVWPGLVVHRWTLHRADLVTVDGVRVTAPVRTALDVAATTTLAESLVLFDGLLRGEIMEAEQLIDGIGVTQPRPGRLRAATAVRLADGRRASAPESVFRALVHGAGLPSPREQFQVRLDGRLLARADFAWPRRRLLVEIDGFAYHSDTRAFVRDRQRQNDVVLAGWRVLRFAAVDVLERPSEVVEAVRAALRLPLPKSA